jgi:hypothetical protein
MAEKKKRKLKRKLLCFRNTDRESPTSLLCLRPNETTNYQALIGIWKKLRFLEYLLYKCKILVVFLLTTKIAITNSVSLHLMINKCWKRSSSTAYIMLCYTMFKLRLLIVVLLSFQGRFLSMHWFSIYSIK